MTPVSISEGLKAHNSMKLSMNTGSNTYSTYTITYAEPYNELTEIESILDMPLEDLPMHINDSISNISKRILALRLEAHI